MPKFNFNDYRKRLNQMVEFDEESFSIRGIQHIGYGFTADSANDLYPNIQIRYSDSNNARKCRSITINVSVYDEDGYYVAGKSKDLDGKEEPWIYFSGAMIDAFSKIVVSLSGEIPTALPDPNVVQAVTTSNGIHFDFVTEGFARHGIKVVSCGSAEIDCNKSYKNQQDVLFELDQAATVEGRTGKSSLNVLLYDADSTLIGVDSREITDFRGRLLSRVVTMEIKISKNRTVKKVKAFLEDQ